MGKTWFITGAGRGFGREFAAAALARGDRVAATARDLSALDGLVDRYGDAVVALNLDVTDRDAVLECVRSAVERLKSLDIVVNNAGYGLFGMVEEITEQQLRDQLEVNLFGAFHVTQAVIPVFRAQGAGHLVQISTVGGVCAFPGLGGYHASKWALEGLSESLAQELSGTGIAITLVEPGPYATDWAGSSAVHAKPMTEYDTLRAALQSAQSQRDPASVGEPAAAGAALLDVVDAEQPPLRVLFGMMPTHVVPPTYAQRLKTWKDWESVSLKANGH